MDFGVKVFKHRVNLIQHIRNLIENNEKGEGNNISKNANDTNFD